METILQKDDMNREGGVSRLFTGNIQNDSTPIRLDKDRQIFQVCIYKFYDILFFIKLHT